MEVSVLVPVLNEAAHLCEAVERMLGQTYAGPVEFLFIDGGSTDGSRERLAELAEGDPRIRLIENPEGTTPRALNRGLNAATGDVVARMDAHARYPLDYLERGVARLRRGDVVSVSGPQLAVGYDDWSRRVALALDSPLGAGGARFRRMTASECEVDSGYTGLWMRSRLVASGGWEDDWVGDEDFELAARLRKLGGRIVCLPELAAEYAPRNNFLDLARQYWRYGEARVRTTNRHPESMRPSHVLPAAAVLTLLLGSVKGHPGRRPAQVGSLLYLTALMMEALKARKRNASLADAVSLPAVFLIMHGAFGLAELKEIVTHGLPPAALMNISRELAGRARARRLGRR